MTTPEMLLPRSIKRWGLTMRKRFGSYRGEDITANFWGWFCDDADGRESAAPHDVTCESAWILGSDFKMGDLPSALQDLVMELADEVEAWE